MPRQAAGTTYVTLPGSLSHHAKELGINLSQVCQRGLAAEVAAISHQRWLGKNRETTATWNDHVADHDLPLAANCQF